ncbi:MAG: SDR family oxidoreductase [Pseudomonadota bacterium]|nr:SDR family oxidoreductase [Pseudomonadota bacterium]
MAGSDAPLAARFSMQGRRALVVGGSLGIGRAIVEAFAEAGASIAIAYSPAADALVGRGDSAAELLRALTDKGGHAALLDVDLAQPGEGARLVARAEAGLGGVDVLVIAASVQQREAFTDISPEQRERQTRINFHASVEMMQAVVPGMRGRAYGRILTIGSVNQTRPEPELAIYAALKSAQHNIVVNLARALAPDGITVNNLSPGLIATDRNRWRRVNMAEWREIEAKANPMHRAGTPREMAGAALMLCSDAGSFITGIDLQATGGGHL